MPHLTWKELADLYPVFVQWVVAKHGPLPGGLIQLEDYERWKKEFENEIRS